MYEGYTRLLIVFLTHLLVVGLVPAPGFLYSWARGVLQASVVLIMHSFSEGVRSAVVQYAYWGALLLWIYIKVQLALKGK